MSRSSPGRSSTTRKRVAAERESQHQPDDLSADAARLGAPDVRGARMLGPGNLAAL